MHVSITLSNNSTASNDTDSQLISQTKKKNGKSNVTSYIFISNVCLSSIKYEIKLKTRLNLMSFECLKTKKKAQQHNTNEVQKLVRSK